jgi:hypothetical protein
MAAVWVPGLYKASGVMKCLGLSCSQEASVSPKSFSSHVFMLIFNNLFTNVEVGGTGGALARYDQVLTK